MELHGAILEQPEYEQLMISRFPYTVVRHGEIGGGYIDVSQTEDENKLFRSLYMTDLHIGLFILHVLTVQANFGN